MRDWIHVDDHTLRGAARSSSAGQIGETYLIGADGERNNLEVVRTDPRARSGAAADDYDLVTDRAGHDLRYAIDSTKLRERARLAAALRRLRGRAGRTIEWYRDARGLVAPAARRRPRRSTPRRASDRVPDCSTPPRSRGCSWSTLDVHGDNRGWFKENWQRAKMTALGLPDFGPVQNNVSFNAAAASPAASTPSRGTSSSRSRPVGSSARGSTCARARRSARRSPVELGPDTAVFVPRGVGNAYQMLEDATAYTYLVNDALAPGAGLHRRQPRRRDAGDRLADPARRGRDRVARRTATTRALADVTPMAAAPMLVVGGCGQLGRGAAPGVPGTRRASTAIGARPGRPGLGRPLRLLVVRRGDQRRRVHRRRRRRDRPRADGAWAANATGPAPCSRRGHASTASRSCTSPPTTSSTARVEEHTEDEPLSPAGGLRPEQGRRRPRRVAPRPGTTCSARPGWSATATTSCAPCSGWPATASRRPSSPTRSAG